MIIYDHHGAEDDDRDGWFISVLCGVSCGLMVFSNASPWWRPSDHWLDQDSASQEAEETLKKWQQARSVAAEISQ